MALTLSVSSHPVFQESAKFLDVSDVGAGAKGDQTKQIEELKKKLSASEAKDHDFGLHGCFVSKPKMRPAAATLKKQAAQQAAEFDRLASKYNEVTGAVSDKKSD
ncbi:hypothetical protein EDB19DRAFT_1908390 [Suillus lakei]|nr:hypothetical protein EDB19DRAFT_1908390 [Suillus lakei]